MTRRHKGFVYGGFIVLECALWGLGNPILKMGAQSIGPFWLVALRFLLAFCVFAALRGRHVLRSLKGIRPLPCLLVCVWTALAFTLGSFALMLTEATTAGFLMGIAVLFTPFLEPLLLRTRFRFGILPLVALVTLGMYLLCGGAGAFTFGAGEWLAVLSSLSFAVMLVLSEKYVAGMDAVALSTMQCAVAGILGLALAFCLEGRLALSGLTLRDVGAVLYLALFSTCAAYLLQNKAIRHIPATFASLAFCTEPIFTALFSYLLLGERLAEQGLVGAGIILAGVMAASARKTNEGAQANGPTRAD